MVIVIVLISSQQFLLPQDAKAVAKSSIWSLFAVANIFFFRHLDTSYFAPESNEIPFLHLWTLGVEEQFYMLWPFFVPVFRRINGIFFLLLIMVSILCFYFAEYFYYISPKFTYYMLPARIGEFIIGIITSALVFKYRYNKLPGVLFSAISFLGFSLIIYSILSISHDNVFPGFLAIPPTLGTAMIILSGHYKKNGLLTRFISMNFFTSIGKISYSLYLWHWPILAFYHYGDYNITLISGIILFLIMIIIAFLSYKYIEVPFRLAKKSAKFILAFYVICPIVCILSIALIAKKIGGQGLRGESYLKKLNVITRNLDYADSDNNVTCHFAPFNISLVEINKQRCFVGDVTKPEKTVLFGDSNSGHFVGMLIEFAKHSGFGFRNFSHYSCPPLETKYILDNSKESEHCKSATKISTTRAKNYDIIIMSARWSMYSNNDRFYGGEKFLDNLFKQIKGYTKEGKKVIIIGEIPHMKSEYSPLCKQKSISMPFMYCKDIFYIDDERNRIIKETNIKLKQFASLNHAVDFFSINNYLCPGEKFCYINLNNIQLFIDAGHLSYVGSQYLARMIIQEEGVPEVFKKIPEVLGKPL